MPALQIQFVSINFNILTAWISKGRKDATNIAVKIILICPFLQCDGISLNLADGPALQGISLLNIPSTHGGTNMWGDSKARR
jgi:hypothetical protein